MASTFAATAVDVVSAGANPSPRPAPLPGCLPADIVELCGLFDNPLVNQRDASRMVNASAEPERNWLSHCFSHIHIWDCDQIAIEDSSDPFD
jgi:hypothetical protein